MARERSRSLFSMAALAALALSAIAADSPDQNSRVAGRSYGWAVTQGQCREEWSFGQDGVMTIVSGEEHVTKRYSLRAMPGSTMVEMEATRLTTDGRPDCQGKRNGKIGQTSLIYLMFLNGGGFFTCMSTDTMSCYGVATPKN